MGRPEVILLSIVCTGGEDLGYGHLMRSVTFARSAPPYFQVSLLARIDEQDDHIFASLNDITQFCRSDLEVLSALEEKRPDIIAWDTVDFTREVVVAAMQIATMQISISPVFRQMDLMDDLFTRVVETPDMPGVEVHRGLKYAIFSDQCRTIPDEVYMKNLGKNHLTVGVSMGGADAPNKTLKIIEAISKLPVSLTIWVMLGEGYRHSYEELVKATKIGKQHEIILAKTNRSMWEVLSNCNVAILAGGLMMIEAVYAGLPSINIFEKSLHEATAGVELFEAGAAVSLGVISEGALEKLNQWLTETSEKRSRLLICRENSKGKIDRLAPDRIYESITNKFRSSLASSL